MDLMIVDLVSADLVASLVKYILAGATILSIPVSLLLIKRYRMVVCAPRVWDAPPRLIRRWQSMRLRKPQTHRRPPLTLSVVDSGHAATDCRGRASLFFREVLTPNQCDCFGVLNRGRGLRRGNDLPSAWAAATRDDARPGTKKIAVLFWSYFWPSVLSFVLVIATSGRARLAALGGYGLVWFSLICVGNRSSQPVDLSVWDLPALLVDRRRATNADAGRSDVRPNSGGRTACASR